MTTTLAIFKSYGEYRLVIGEPYGTSCAGEPLSVHRWGSDVSVSVGFGKFSSRPDPIHRAWAHLEAKRGLALAQEHVANTAQQARVEPKGFGWPFRSWVGPWMASRGEKQSQQLQP